MTAQALVPLPSSEISTLAREAPETRIVIAVASMSHIQNLTEEDTLDSIVDVVRAHTRTFLTLAKLIVHLQELRPDIRFLGPYLHERGIRLSTIKNATAAVRVWHGAVKTGILSEEQFDELTFMECLSISRAIGMGQHVRRQSIVLAIESAARSESNSDLSDVEMEGSPQITVNSRGVKINGPCTWEEWSSLLGKWAQFKDNWHFGLADLVLYGKTHFGHADVASELERHSYSRPDVTTAMAIEVVPEAKRQDSTLSSGHYRAIAKAGPDLNDKQRDKWVQIAENQGLTTTELKRSVAAGRVIRTNAEENGRNSGIDTIQGVRFMFDQWKIRMEKKGIIFTEKSRKDRTDLMEELQPMHDLYVALQKSLQDS